MKSANFEFIRLLHKELAEPWHVPLPPLRFQQRVLLLRRKSDVLDNGFLKEVLKLPIVCNQIAQRATGSTVRGIRQKELRQVLVPILDIALQKELSNIARNFEAKTSRHAKKVRQMETLIGSLTQRAFYGEL